MDDRLPAHLWIMAQVRRCNATGLPAMVVRKGEQMGGLVLLKLNLLNGTARVLTQQRNLAGELGWLAALGGGAVPESEADAYIARSSTRDPDLWVIEVETHADENPFEGKLI